MKMQKLNDFIGGEVMKFDCQAKESAKKQAENGRRRASIGESEREQVSKSKRAGKSLCFFFVYFFNGAWGRRTSVQKKTNETRAQKTSAAN